MPASEKRQSPALRGWQLLALATAFGLAYTLAPLYFSNQNQYLLHGAAQAGLGLLDQDWLANTSDPTPVFSSLVAFTYRWLGENAFHVEYFLLLMVYFCSLAELPALIPGPPLSNLGRFVFLTLVIVIHAGVLRLWSVRLFGVDYPWYFQSGVAGQYVLGPSLQPSAFGVLLVASVVAFGRGWPFFAAAWAAAAAIMHATYLLPAGLLIATYVALLGTAGRWGKGLLLGIGALLAVLPTLVYSIQTFGPTSPEQFSEAQRILAEIRIPHHADVRQWLDGIAVAQLAWIALGVLLTWRGPLFPLLVVPALGGLALTLVQVATGSYTLALLFPWRVSAILMPLATAVIFARGIGAAETWFSRRPQMERGVWVSAAGLLVAAVVGGVIVMWLGLGYQSDDGELPMMEYVRRHRQSGDVYLLPVRIPPVASGRGSVSTSFRPPKPEDAALIQVDLQRFRLLALAPIYVDFKSVPYKDVEVLEWYRRMQFCNLRSVKNDLSNPKVRLELADEGITHIVMRADQPLSGSAGEMVYEDKRYRIYRLR
jgi:hypothetical protein